MENVCRLCANVKTPRQLTCSIDDQSLNIEQKLIDCCRWKLYDNYETYNLPQRICNACFKNLERSWAFAESVTQAQQELLIRAVDSKPLVLLEIECADTIENKLDHIEEIKVSLSPHNVFNYEYDFEETMPETSNYKRMTTKGNESNELETKGIKYKNRLDIDQLLALLSENDKNEDGTINKEKILELDLDDWSMVKWRCCVCKSIHENTRQLKAHFERNHTTDSLRLLCSFCNSSFGGRRSVLRHIIKKHRPYLKLRFVFTYL